MLSKAKHRESVLNYVDSSDIITIQADDVYHDHYATGLTVLGKVAALLSLPVNCAR
jgi:hypothetical protein